MATTDSIIDIAKVELLENTDIAKHPDEMAVFDKTLLRCYEMGWLDKYDENKERIYIDVNKDNVARIANDTPYDLVKLKRLLLKIGSICNLRACHECPYHAPGSRCKVMRLLHTDKWPSCLELEEEEKDGV